MSAPSPADATLADPSRSVELHLYYDPTCAYCRDVLRALEPLELNVTLHDVDADADARSRLVAAMGRARVPVLEIIRDAPPEGDLSGAGLDERAADLPTTRRRWMAESLDIIRELRTLAGHPTQAAWVDQVARLSRPVGLGMMLGALLVEGPMATALLIGGAVVFGLGLLRRLFL